jgi:hypothetical protein
MPFIFDARELRPVVKMVVEEVLRQAKSDQAKLDGNKLAFSEEEAARLLDIEPHVLRDERRRGKIKASQIVGRRIRYMQSDLLDYMLSRRYGEGGED